MDSREKILDRVRQNQPAASPLGELPHSAPTSEGLVQTFIRSLGNIGGTAIEAADWDEIATHLSNRFPKGSRWISMIPHLGRKSISEDLQKDPRSLENVSLSILEGHFGVAENGAIWITEKNMGDRVLPFICEHLVLVINGSMMVNTMQDAYQQLDSSDHSFGTFIAGPSKTADIEQSLVLGAHGPKTLTVFILNGGEGVL